MATKNIIRSMRFSEDVAKLIEQQQGRNFTEKFENLVIECVWQLSKKKQELQQIQDQIDREKKRLNQLEQKRQKLQAAMDQMEGVLAHCLCTAGETLQELKQM